MCYQINAQVKPRRYLAMDQNFEAVIPSYIDTFDIYDNCELSYAIQYPLLGEKVDIFDSKIPIEIIAEDGNKTVGKILLI